MRKGLILILCLLILVTSATAGGLQSIINSYNQIKHDYKEYQKMGAFDKDGNLQPYNILVYMEGKSGASEVTGTDKLKIIDGSPLYRHGKMVIYERIPRENKIRQIEDINRLFDKLGITLDKEKPPEKLPIVDEGMEVIWR